MAVFNHLRKEIDAKIVYYGPGISGKTTNLQFIHQNLKPEQRGKMVSLATEEERTLFFDFLPIELESVRGFRTRFHLYTVPGQIYYGATRRAVLSGADGVIFVADSQAERMEDNLMSLKDLEENLRYYGKRIETIPLVMQYNKRDLPHISAVEELNQKINRWQAPYFEAVAITGKGVFETLTMACRLVLKAIEEGVETRRTARRPEIIPEKVPVMAGMPVGQEVVASSLKERKEFASVPAAEPAGVLKGTAPVLEIKTEKEIPTLREKIIPLESKPLEKMGEIVPQKEVPAKVEEEKRKEGEKTFWGRMFNKIWPETEPKAEGEAPKPAVLSPTNLRLVSVEQPQIVSPTSLQIPLTLEIGEKGKRYSCALTINLEKIEPKLG